MQMLIAEHDPALAAFLRRGMEQDGYEVALATGFEQALEAARLSPPAIAILDVDDPKNDGMDILRGMRARTAEIHLVALLSGHDAAVRLHCLEAGADDVVEKPLSLAELRARCRGLLRRRAPGLILRHGALEVNRIDRTLTRDGATVPLTNREYALLAFLLERRGNAVSRRALLERVWKRTAGVQTNVVDVYVNYLRRKVADSTVIQTVRGQGYRIAAEAWEK
ncbi:MAG TPA: response regulator transcription factor [Acidobacteriaceae bacterium]|nr:response regulator transcription factor [Acidobacteriaceae bacterium]